METLGTLLTTAPLSIYTEQAGSMGAAMAFGGCLPIHVRFMLDEFANMGVIPDADKKLSVMQAPLKRVGERRG